MDAYCIPATATMYYELRIFLELRMWEFVIRNSVSIRNS